MSVDVANCEEKGHCKRISCFLAQLHRGEAVLTSTTRQCVGRFQASGIMSDIPNTKHHGAFLTVHRGNAAASPQKKSNIYDR